jgi:hypothetical protein
MEEVIPRLWVGDDADYEKVKGRPHWAILRCCKYGPGGHQQTLGYDTLGAPEGKNHFWVRRGNVLALNLLDLDDPHFIDQSMMDTALAFIQEQLDAGEIVLVACNKGHSRGPSVAMLFLRKIGYLPYSFIVSERMYRHQRYPLYDAAQGIRQYVRQHWADWQYQERRRW